jgi:hypothetical protein
MFNVHFNMMGGGIIFVDILHRAIAGLRDQIVKYTRKHQ